jgi:hypothetical protein
MAGYIGHFFWIGAFPFGITLAIKRKTFHSKKKKKMSATKQIYRIGELAFKTKVAVKRYVRSELERLGYRKVNKEDEKDFSFLYNVFRNHSEFAEKEGAGVYKFIIEPNPMTGDSYQTSIIRNDHSRDTFSWVHCTEFKPRSTASDLAMAMREAVQLQIKAFRDEAPRICAMDDCKYNEHLCVDHIYAFRYLKDEFLIQTTLPAPTQFTSCEQTRMTKFRDEDSQFANEWQKYHRQRATLQILCRTCNNKKG